MNRRLRTSRKGSWVFAPWVAFALLLSVSGLAWACTPQPFFRPLANPPGAPGTVITVAGDSLGRAPLELRWKSPSGRPVGAPVPVENTAFRAMVTVPDVEPGVLFLLLMSREEILSRTAFEVVAPTAPTESGRVTGPRNDGAADPWSTAGAGQDEASAGAGAQSRAAAGLLFGLGSAGILSCVAVLVVQRRRAGAERRE